MQEYFSSYKKEDLSFIKNMMFKILQLKKYKTKIV